MDDALTTMFYGYLLKKILEKVEIHGRTLSPEAEIFKKQLEEKLGFSNE